MPSYVAMLRGINVSGSKMIKMEALRASFEALGFTNVRSYVQSGNVVFTAKDRTAAPLGAKIAARIKRDYGYDVPTLVLGAEALARVVDENPFLGKKGVDPTKLHVTFLAEAPAAAGLERMQAVSSGRDQFQCLGTSIYLVCPDGAATRSSTTTPSNAPSALAPRPATGRPSPLWPRWRPRADPRARLPPRPGEHRADERAPRQRRDGRLRRPHRRDQRPRRRRAPGSSGA